MELLKEFINHLGSFVGSMITIMLLIVAFVCCTSGFILFIYSLSKTLINWIRGE